VEEGNIMGTNINIFSEKNGPYYYDKASPARLELEECIHFHLGSYRFVWSTEEFKEIAQLFEQAYQKIVEMGSPEISDKMISLSDRTY
jgi:hypothetical protein